MLSTVGVYVAAALVVLIVLLATATSLVGAWFHGSNQIAAIWVERNVLLMDTYWPRRCQLELVRYQGDANGELRVARDENRPDVQVRAIKWVFADRNAPEGWRALMAADLVTLPLSNAAADVKLPSDWDGWVIDLDDLDSKVPNGVIPVEWKWSGKTSGQIRGELKTPLVRAQLAEKLAVSSRASQAIEQLLDWRTWTIDKLELQLKRFDVRQTLQAQHPVVHDKLEKLLTELANLADQPSMGRSMRQLIVPDTVQVNRRGKFTKGSTPHPRQENNKYSFSLNDLKESVRFTVSAEDFSTRSKLVTLVPPPSIQPLLAHKEEPAYLHYRYLADPLALKGKRQHFRHQAIPTTGPRSIIPVPLGSSLALTAHLDRDLKPNTAQVVAPAKRDEAGSITPVLTVREEGQRAFSVEIKNVTKVLEFDLEFRDSDGVKGQRRIVVRPVDDAAPTLSEINLATNLRPEHEGDTAKPGQAAEGNPFLITPDAFVPFRGVVADDRSLAKVSWKWEFVELEFKVPGEKGKEPTFVLKGDVPTRRASLAVSTFQFGPGFQWFSPAYYATLSNLVKSDAARPDANLRSAKGIKALKKFTQRHENRGGDFALDEIERMLLVNPRNRLDLADLLETRPKIDAYVKDLDIDLPRQAILTDLGHFLKLDHIGKQLKARPADALKDMLDAAAKNLEEKDALTKLLRRRPEAALQSLSKHSLDFEKEFDRDGRLNGGGFDVKEFLPQLKAPGSETQPHYELRLYLSATDNNIETGPSSSPDRGPFLFKVISENELLVEILKQRRKLYSLLKETVDALDGRKTTLDTEAEKLKFSQADVALTAIRTDQARKATRETGDISKAVLDKYQTIIEELRVNRVREDEITVVERKITVPLATLLMRNVGEFDQTTSKLKELYDDLDTDLRLLRKAEEEKRVDAKLLELLDFNRKETHLPNAQAAAGRLGILVRQLRNVLEAMQDIEEETRLIEYLVQIEASHRDYLQRIVNHRRWLEDDLRKILNPDGK